MKTLALVLMIAALGFACRAVGSPLSPANSTSSTTTAQSSPPPAGASSWLVALDSTGSGMFGPRHRLWLNLNPPDGAPAVSTLNLIYGDSPLAVLKFDRPIVPKGLVAFDFTLNDATRSSWGRAYSDSTSPIAVKLMMTDAGSGQTSVIAENIPITLPHSRLETWIVATVVLAILVAVIWLGVRSDLLRDPGPEPMQGRRPYSLSRFQMAVWTVVVVWAFLYIWQHAGEAPALTPSVLALIGIASGTGLGSAVIAVSKRGQDLQSLADQQTKLTQLATTPGVLPQQLTETRNEVARLQRRLAPQRSENPLTDILSDNDGISFHRFQLLAWTIVLVVVFVYETIGGLEIHNFDPTVLGLMGISSGTYIGFKIPE